VGRGSSPWGSSRGRHRGSDLCTFAPGLTVPQRGGGASRAESGSTETEENGRLALAGRRLAEARGGRRARVRRAGSVGLKPELDWGGGAGERRRGREEESGVLGLGFCYVPELGKNLLLPQGIIFRHTCTSLDLNYFH
jgi:hypothetical protein